MADSNPVLATDRMVQRHKAWDKRHREHLKHSKAVSKSKKHKVSKPWKKKPPTLPNESNPDGKQKIYKIFKPWSRKSAPFPDAQRRRLRDIKRKFQHHSAAKIPATMRTQLEREAQSIAHELAIHEAEERRKHMMAVTKRQRFFEQQKALRRLKKAEKEKIEENNSGSDSMTLLEDAQLDLAYANFYPLEANYVPLWPNHQNEPSETKGDPVMRERIKTAMADGKLEELKHELTVSEDIIVGEDEGKQDEEDESFFTK